MPQTRSTHYNSAQQSENAKNPHHDMPKKARIRAQIKLVEQGVLQGPDFTKQRIFEREGVSKTRGYAMLKENPETDRTAHQRGEMRGRKAILSDKDIRHIEDFLEQADFAERAYSYESIITEFDLPCSVTTLRREIHNLDYWKCVACTRGWVSHDQAQRRKEYAEVMKQRYPTKEDWYLVRFSDEVHFGFGPQGKILIFRKPGQRYCSSCIQEREEPSEADLKRLHAWGAAGHGFKSDLEFYTIPPKEGTLKDRNTGKMTANVYLERILKGVVEPWIKRGDQFTLEEDQDSSHGAYNGKNPDNKALKTYPVRQWKESMEDLYGIHFYFNSSGSPDTSPIENLWQPVKANIRKYPHWDKHTTKELAVEGWKGISQSHIDKLVDTMPKRWQDVIDADGKMTGW